MDPSIKWYQKAEQVILTIDIENIINPDISFLQKQLIINFKENEKTYTKNLNLENEIIPENSNWELNNKLVINLKKKEKKIWTKLTTTKISNIFIDWTNWNFIDEVPSNIKDNIVNNNIQEALATMNIEKIHTDKEMIENFILSDSD